MQLKPGHIVSGIFLIALICCAGCSTQQAPSGKGATTIAVIPKGTTHAFWKSVHAGALKAAKEFGVEIRWQGPLKEDDREAQIRRVEEFVSTNVSGICLAPLDDVALKAPVAAAQSKNIPVVIFDSSLKDVDYVSFVATDNYKGGELAAEEMGRLLFGKGRVVVLRYQEGSASTFDREKGFLDGIKRFPGIKIVTASQYGGTTRETAFAASERLLAPLKGAGGKLNAEGIFCPNESTTFGMLRALQDANLVGTVRFVGFDSAPELVTALTEKQIDALVVQDPMKMGYLAVKAMVEHLGGKEVEKRIDTGAYLVTLGNMQEPQIKELLNPPLDEWLQ